MSHIITQDEIDVLVQEAEQKIILLKNMLEQHLSLFNDYSWYDQRMGNHDNLRIKLNTWINRLDQYKVDPTKVADAKEKHLPVFYWKKQKLVGLIEFLEFAEESVATNIIQRCNDSLLNALGAIINRYVMKDGFIPQD